MSTYDYFLTDNFDVKVETRDTVEDWNALIDEVQVNYTNTLMNILLMNDLSMALNEGIDLSTEKLGDYWLEHLKIEQNRKRLERNQDEVMMMNWYGEAYHRSQKLPILTMRDKETGDLIEALLPEEGVPGRILDALR